MGDLLKEAIADAKAVRETALANAKAALEEAFTPKLQSMLTKKLKEDDLEGEEEFPAEEDEELPAEEEEGYSEEDELEGGDEKEIDVAVDDEVPAEEDDLAGEEDLGGEEEEGEDLDLEAIIRELEDEEGGEELPAEEDDAVEETIEVNGKKYQAIKEEDEEDDETVEEEVDQSSGVGNSDEEGFEEESFDDPAKPLNITEDDGEDEGDSDDLDEIVDLSELLKGLKEEDEESTEEDEEVKEENVRLTTALGEHRKVVKYLRNKLNEVNLLNAKLLFTNKLFRSYNLNNNQKLKIVETFDRAKSAREVKLVYSTLAESFAGRTGSRVEKINETKSYASKVSASTAPKKVISEGNDLANRFKKLAGIIK